MPQTEIGQRVSLSLLARKQGETKKAEPYRLLPCFWTHVGAQVALQRCPILRMSDFSVPCLSITPSQRGHLYFAEKGTSLLCLDSTKRHFLGVFCFHFARIVDKKASP